MEPSSEFVPPITNVPVSPSRIDESGAEQRTRIRIRLEPVIDDRTLNLTPDQIDRMASNHFRWAKQLWLRSAILRQELGLPPKTRASRRRRSVSPTPPRSHPTTPDLPWAEPLEEEDELEGVPI